MQKISAARNGRPCYPHVWLGIIFVFTAATAGGKVKLELSKSEKDFIISTANACLDSLPYSITSARCERSAGGPNDFYSEGDYWWPDPQNPSGPYVRRDGETNPDNFVAHRLAMARFSRMVGALASAYILTSEDKYARKVSEHLAAWFVNRATRMNPHMLYAQAIQGRVTGRGIGIIDAIHLIEVARAVQMMQRAPAMPHEIVQQTKAWFKDFLHWISTHPYGVEEMNWNNNHATCWTMQAAAFADLTGDRETLAFCAKRFKEVLLPNQMAVNGAFPQELNRTKPYGYSLFNLDAMATLCHILSTREENLWEYATADGKSMKKAMTFIYPFIVDKSKWPYPKDVMYWDEWPVRHPSLLFAALAYDDKNYLKTWQTLNGYPTNEEVLRNLPIRHPLLWIDGRPAVDSPRARITYLNAGGLGDTYELIKSVLGPQSEVQDVIDIPDCVHPVRHIHETWDEELKKQVFVFDMHAKADNDRCKNFDRQRNEIKTYDTSPDSLKGTAGETHVYRWKFRVDRDLQVSPRFTHLFQIKARGGTEDGMPIITLSAARKANGERFEIRHSDSNTSFKVVTDTSLALIKGEWLEVYCRAVYAERGSIDLVVRNLKGSIMLQYKNESLDMWRTEANCNYPKWGIYRGLVDDSSLRDEQVRFADFSITEE